MATKTPTAASKERAQGALTLAEINKLQAQVAKLKSEVRELRAKLKALEKEKEQPDLVDPAALKAYRRFKGFS